MSIGAWVIVIFACFLVAATYCAWEERRDEKRAREDFREHLAHPAHPVVRDTDELDGAA